jgi:hypothetical protein
VLSRGAVSEIVLVCPNPAFFFNSSTVKVNSFQSGVSINLGAVRESTIDAHRKNYHSGGRRERNPDTELRVDGETDTLFSDGIDIEGNFDTAAGTDGSSGRIP